MRKLLLLLLALGSFTGCDAALDKQPVADSHPSPSASANLFVGTGGTGFGQGSAYPGAAMPFGLVKLSPDTNGGDFDRLAFAHFGGYWYGGTHIEGFSHLHLHGTGAIDYGVVTVMPSNGMSAAKTSYTGYALPFTHDAEHASPGYYAVTFPAEKITAELTATPHAGVHRYTFAPGSDAVVLLDLGHALDSVEVLDAELTIDAAGRRVYGSLLQAGGFSGRFGGIRVYFDGVFDQPWSEQGTWSGEALQAGAVTAAATIAKGNVRTGAYFHFSPDVPVELRMGISLVSAAAAKQNRTAETDGKRFDDVLAAARAAWAKELGRIEVAGGTATARRIFFSALYHVFQLPTLYSDVSGKYRTVNAGVAEAKGFRFYSDMSLWDTYRTFHPLLALLSPAYTRDFVRSLQVMSEERGSLPKWPMGTGDGASMVGTPADIVVSDAYVKGVHGFDAEGVFARMVSTAVNGDPYAMRRAREAYWDLGYCPAEQVNGSVAVTLENMYADFAIARMAEALGDTANQARFDAQSARFDTLWDADVQFFRGKTTDGAWSVSAFDPSEHSEDYVEGTAWQYVWFAPWNFAKLATLFGGADKLVAKLDEFFKRSMEAPPGAVGQIRLQDNYYWHGNEPDIHAAYLYVLAGRPDKAAPVIRWILETKYKDAPDGLDGNDDGGTLSSWYVWSAMGLYPMPAETRYLLGSPLFEKAVIHLENGNDMTIVAPGAAMGRGYLEAAYWNGERLAHPWILHEQLTQGGELRMVLRDDD